MEKRKPFYDGNELVQRTVYYPKPTEPLVSEERMKEYIKEQYELPKWERLMLDFWYERREPVNEKERKLQEEVLEIKKSGGTLYFDGEAF